MTGTLVSLSADERRYLREKIAHDLLKGRLSPQTHAGKQRSRWLASLRTKLEDLDPQANVSRSRSTL